MSIRAARSAAARLPGWALVGVLDAIGILALVMVRPGWVACLIVVAVLVLTALFEPFMGWGCRDADPCSR